MSHTRDTGDGQTSQARKIRRLLEPALPAATALAVVSGGIAWAAGNQDAADACWAAGTVLAVVPALAWVVAALSEGRAGVDLIAVMALVGTLVVGEYLAGALIPSMPATGRTLDAAAERRASRDLRALLEHAPARPAAAPAARSAWSRSPMSSSATCSAPETWSPSTAMSRPVGRNSTSPC